MTGSTALGGRDVSGFEEVYAIDMTDWAALGQIDNAQETTW
jgi:hypothetical protein